MKKLGTVIAGFFVLMAAALGWFLPLAAFNIEDRFAEGKEMKLAIEQINLSYRDDLAINQKINVINFEYDPSMALKIDKGIYHQSDDIERIVSDFVADFTGLRYDVKYGAYAVPYLINLSNNRGTVVIWVVSCTVTGTWTMNCLIDDKTGAILKCNLTSDGQQGWGELVLGAQEYTNISKSISERFSNALYNHYVRQISAKLVTYNKVPDSEVEGNVGYTLVFRDSKNYTFQITVQVENVYPALATF